MIEMRKQVEPGNTTPPEISVMQIDQDLKDGITKAEMAVKYNIKPWEVDEMFKHPFLKGRRPSRKKALSFKFVDDTVESTECKTTHITDPEEFTDPNQITLEDAIDEAIETVEDAKQEMQEAEKAIVDALSPTEYETPQETIQNAAVNTTNIEAEEELEMDDDTFEL